jgi:hypothetical protein
MPQAPPRKPAGPRQLPKRPTQHDPENPSLDRKKKREDELLDESLEETFPASDPASAGRFT